MTPQDPRDAAVAEYIPEVAIDAIASHVHEQFTRAIMVRRPITERMQRAIYARNLSYMPGECPEGEVNVYSGLVSAKATVVESWLKGVLLSAVPQLWTLEPTERPELPQAVNDAIYARLLQALQQSGLSPDEVEVAREAMEKMARKHVADIASENTEHIVTYIKDMLDDGGFIAELSEALSDLAHNTHMVMAGPTLVAKPTIVHDDAPDSISGVKVVTKMTLAFRRVDPLTFYWSNDSTNPQDGAFVIEDASVCMNELLDAVESKVPGFIPEAVWKITDQNWAYNHSMTPTDQYLEHVRKGHAMVGHSDNRRRCVKYSGLIPGNKLEHYMDGIDKRRHYECEVWIIDGTTVRLMFNQNPMTNRNFYTASLYSKAGAMVGMGVCDVVHDSQRMCNAAMRATAKNMPFAAAPWGEFDSSRLANANDRANFVLRPEKLYEVEPDPFGGGRPVITLNTIPSNAAEFNGIYQSYSQEADRISGIPAYISGQIDIASMARTATGLSILMKSATVVLQNGVMNIDSRLFAKLISACYMWVMLYHPDPAIKADARVRARGASGVLNREMSQAKLYDLLQLLAPYAGSGLLPPTVILTLLREIVEGSGYDPDKIIPPDAAAQALEFANALAAARAPPAPIQFAPQTAPMGPTDQPPQPQVM